MDLEFKEIRYIAPRPKSHLYFLLQGIQNRSLIHFSLQFAFQLDTQKTLNLVNSLLHIARNPLRVKALLIFCQGIIS